MHSAVKGAGPTMGASPHPRPISPRLFLPSILWELAIETGSALIQSHQPPSRRALPLGTWPSLVPQFLHLESGVNITYPGPFLGCLQI